MFFDASYRSSNPLSASSLPPILSLYILKLAPRFDEQKGVLFTPSPCHSQCTENVLWPLKHEDFLSWEQSLLSSWMCNQASFLFWCQSSPKHHITATLMTDVQCQRWLCMDKTDWSACLWFRSLRLGLSSFFGKLSSIYDSHIRLHQCLFENELKIVK